MVQGRGWSRDVAPAGLGQGSEGAADGESRARWIVNLEETGDVGGECSISNKRGSRCIGN